MGEALSTVELELWAVDLVGLQVVRCAVSVVPQQGAEVGSGSAPKLYPRVYLEQSQHSF